MGAILMFILPLTVGVLTAGGVWLLLQRSMVRSIFGLTLLSHAVNVLLLTTGVAAWRTEPLLDKTTPEQAADPLPMAFVLTAIVISMASTILMLTMAAIGRNDDQRIAPDTEEHA